MDGECKKKFKVKRDFWFAWKEQDFRDENLRIFLFFSYLAFRQVVQSQPRQGTAALERQCRKVVNCILLQFIGTVWVLLQFISKEHSIVIYYSLSPTFFILFWYKPYLAYHSENCLLCEATNFRFGTSLASTWSLQKNQQVPDLIYIKENK